MKEKSKLEIISDETKEIDQDEALKSASDEVKNDIDEERKKGEKLVFDNKKTGKSWIVFLVLGIISFIGGLGCLLFVFLKPPEERPMLAFPTIPSKTETEEVYSSLTGQVLDNPDLKNGPAFCIQIPNGLDGARPQAGLTQAGVVFEAIAEAGITRFAAIFQNPTSAVIGPIRSLRIYYLNWDTPFDCTIVHAGGSGDAIAALRAGGYKDHNENYYYMFRGTAGSRLWNNLFTTAGDLDRFTADSGYTTSNINGFSRLTPAEAEKARVDGLVAQKLNIITGTDKNTSELVTKTPFVGIRFGGVPSFNIDYNYDILSNTYLRSFQDGSPHNVYECPNDDLGKVNPEGACNLTQLAPKVVIAMIVQERRAADNYHEDIDSIGSGEAIVFQNGTATHGSWNKGSAGEQIKFIDDSGNEIRLVPGQTFISAVPAYGGVEY